MSFLVFTSHLSAPLSASLPSATGSVCPVAPLCCCPAACPQHFSQALPAMVSGVQADTIPVSESRVPTNATDSGSLLASASGSQSGTHPPSFSVSSVDLSSSMSSSKMLPLLLASCLASRGLLPWVPTSWLLPGPIYLPKSMLIYALKSWSGILLLGLLHQRGKARRHAACGTAGVLWKPSLL